LKAIFLGVFGNWGSGKSFFMRRLQNAIGELADSARLQAENDSAASPVHWSNILQVEFNVWHYFDANLWASLGAHLFERLRRYREPELDGESESELELALQQLSLATAARDAATELAKAAVSARDETQRTLDQANSNVATTAERLAEATARSLWSDVDLRLSTSGISNEINQARQAVSTSEHAISEATNSVRPLYDEIKDLTSTGGQMRVLLLKLMSAPGGGRVLLQSALLVAAPAVVLLVLGSHWNADLEQTGTSLAATMVGGALSVTRLANWVRARSSELLRALEPLVKARARIEAALSDAEAARAKEIANLRKQLAVEAAALETAQRAVSAREEQVQTAAASVSAAVTGSAISRFIEQHLASNDYQKALGLIAVIRRDFEQLSQLILGHNAQRRRLSQDAARIEQEVKKALPHLEPAVLKRMFENLGVNRIVIYIDDLDRCPPARVVEVLQAIHLLLAFPVFVVVVGVDVRWVQHSLALEYPSLLGPREAADCPAGATARVTPSDYLEKIFQIPFWIPPLEVDTTRSLLTTMTRPALRRAAAPDGALEATGGDDQTDAATSSDTQHSHSGAPTQPIGNDSLARSTPLQAIPLSEAECGAMSELASLVGRSPRSTKRFVNSFRLLKAALGPAASAGGDLRLATPMLMLAVVTGVPMLAAEFLIPPSPSTEGKTTTPLEHLAKLADASTSDAAVFHTLMRVRDFCAMPPSPRWEQIEFSDILRWKKRVSQFAFEDLTTPIDARSVHGEPHGASQAHG
jgi:hypothetical protein